MREAFENGLPDSFLRDVEAPPAIRRQLINVPIPSTRVPPQPRPIQGYIQGYFSYTHREPAIDDLVASSIPDTCQGCQNYHGQVHGGNLLVCAIHPHGWDEGSCPDFVEK